VSFYHQFDGVYGVLAALEVIRTIKDLGIKLKRPVEAVNWTNEEGARFQVESFLCASVVNVHRYG